MKALIVVDIQNDFLKNGKLAIADTDFLVEKINKTILLLDKKNWITISTMDYHPWNHCSFKQYGGIWPKHCVKYTKGCKLHSDLIKCDYNIKKGIKKDSESYSGFYLFDNKYSKLFKILKKHNVNEVYVCGLAFDVCVLNTCLDAIKFKLKVFALKDLAQSVNLKNINKTLKIYKQNNIEVIESKKI